MTIAHPPHPTTSPRDKFSPAELQLAADHYHAQAPVHWTTDLTTLTLINGVPYRRIVCVHAFNPVYLHMPHATLLHYVRMGYQLARCCTLTIGGAAGATYHVQFKRTACIPVASIDAQLACQYARMQQQQQQQCPVVA